MNDNVKIPLSLFNQVFYVLENINIYSYCDDFQTEYFVLIDALNRKKAALELREAYAGIIRAKDEDSRHWAKMRYLQQKRLINEGF
jgi:hypothetical protein